jgi:tetratricopeptide (TPR) repeat protein
MAILLSALCFAGSALPQAAGGAADQNTPAALKSAYDRAMQDKDWSGAVTAAQRLVALRASADNFLLLANAQIYSNSPEDALITYDRALAAAQQEKPPQSQPNIVWRDLVGKIAISKGNVYLKLHHNADAIAEYNKAAAIAPNPGLAYFNICALTYNSGDVDAATSSCRKALQADPTRADAWFVLGSLLYADSKLDAQGKFTLSAECRQALDKYLELAPTGPHAADVKAMLDMAAK